jgi:Fe-Mn family superoxide dismutase
MNTFTQKTFNLRELKGISTKNIEEHLKLYAGYVKNANLILEKINDLYKNEVENSYIISELQRRFSFEFGGIRNHEYYFSALENGPISPTKESALMSAIQKDFGSFDTWLSRFKALALTRGIGWAMLSYDKKTGQLLNSWTDEQHVGHLVSTSPIICLDMWEHAYLFDYVPADKKKYIEAFFENLNWKILEENFTKAL